MIRSNDPAELLQDIVAAIIIVGSLAVLFWMMSLVLS